MSSILSIASTLACNCSQGGRDEGDHPETTGLSPSRSTLAAPVSSRSLILQFCRENSFDLRSNSNVRPLSKASAWPLAPLLLSG